MGITVDLTKENFIRQMVEHGYFAEQIPECFNSKTLLLYLDDVLKEIGCGKNQSTRSNYTSPATLSTYKNDISRRTISLPNPKAFLRVVKLISMNWEDFKKASESKHSLSKIIYLNEYKDTAIEFINSENLRENNGLKSELVKGVRKCIRTSLGYKYRLKIDIANFYDNIYTHSISWAMCGKAFAKDCFLGKKPKSDIYDLSIKFDDFIRLQKGNETNGILTGPFTSRIFSEIILASLDCIFEKKQFKFKRYVDDYKFYFRTESKALESIPKIENILNTYNLNLNTYKTEIKQYPYENIYSIKKTFDSIGKKNVLKILSEASRLYSSGELGAYKYALKYIRNEVIEEKDELEIVLSELTNIMLINPKLGKIIVPFLKNNISHKYIEGLSMIYNIELYSAIINELQEETLLFLYIFKELNLDIDGKNILEIILSNNDFAIIIALDIWKNRNESVSRNISVAKEINKGIVKLAESLQCEKYSGSRWLLMHEIKMHSLISKKHFNNTEQDAFFQKLNNKGISFYSSIK